AAGREPTVVAALLDVLHDREAEGGVRAGAAKALGGVGGGGGGGPRGGAALVGGGGEGGGGGAGGAGAGGWGMRGGWRGEAGGAGGGARVMAALLDALRDREAEGWRGLPVTHLEAGWAARDAAAKALGQLGAAAGREPRVVAALLDALRDRKAEWEVHAEAR